jgi:hypothetical protein
VPLQVNEVQLTDSYFINPFNEAKQQSSHVYLTTSDKVKSEKILWPDTYFYANIFLSDRKIIRKRSVYDILTLIAEVSGFADMFVVTATAILGVLY